MWPDWAPSRRVAPALIPVSWRAHGFPRASGPADAEVWCLGTGPFELASVSTGLQLRPDPPRHGEVRHGVVEPADDLTLSAYQAALAATRAGWEAVRPEDEP